MKRKKRILLLAGTAGRDRLALELGRVIEERLSLEPVFLAAQPAANMTLAATGIPEERRYNLEIGRWREATADEGRLRLIEDEMMGPDNRARPFWQAWASLRRGRTDRETALRVLSWVISRHNEMLDRIEPDIAVGDSMASFQTILLSKQCEDRGIPFLTAFPSRYPGRFLIHRGVDERLPEQTEEYRRLRRDGIPEAEAAGIREWVAEFREGRKRMDPASTRASRERLKKPRSRVKNLLTSMTAYRHQRYGFIFPSRLGPLGYPWSRMKVEARRLILPLRVRFDPPPREGERYGLFPLHNQPEATTLVKGTFFTDQIALVENIARSLPVDIPLYVKEHWIGAGNRPPGFYRELRRHPNVRLLGPDHPSRPIIRGARFVFTISGTPGWEAMIYGVPAVVFGRVFYDDFDAGVFPFPGWERLAALLRRLDTDFSPDDEALHAYLAAHLRVTYPGFPMAPMACGGSSLREENLVAVADGIGDYIRARGLL